VPRWTCPGCSTEWATKLTVCGRCRTPSAMPVGTSSVRVVGKLATARGHGVGRPTGAGKPIGGRR
jgi:LSD1 subclass zinc finger protein